MHFTKLRLTGFKSFVEPTEFLIEPGLTGIVGPNGCGKSNLVEALQWVMGETSARRLRGGEMDDVIFGGTASRPARNIATVCLSVDNHDRTAPAHLNEHDELEIERRIDRDKGSTYRVNSREQRARDVQILFADAASGAQSVALVGQGRIGWLINAKPVERRMLLEEAAGIGGLQARRHEAELRLAATDHNLTRLEDVAATLVQQIDRLKRQVRQAERYRQLSESLRRTEALVLQRHFLDRNARLEAAIIRLRDAGGAAKAAAIAAAEAMAERLRCAESIPSARAAADEVARLLERLTLEAQAVAGEERAVIRQIQDLRQTLTQTEHDFARETALLAQSDGNLARLQAESQTIDATATGATATQAEISAKAQAATTTLREAETALSLATARLAQQQAERAGAQRRLAAIDDRRQRLKRQYTEAQARAAELDLMAVAPERMARAAQAVSDAEARIEAARTDAEQRERDIKTAEAAESAARPAARAAEQRSLALAAEIQALKKLADSPTISGAKPILDLISVQPGFEIALGAALGDDLLAGTDAAAAIYWSGLGAEALPPLSWPEGVTPLSQVVTAPPMLARCLAMIGLVADKSAGDRLHPKLSPGQLLAAADGGLWRWDGLVAAAGAPTAAATRLAQRNRLAELAREAEDATQVLAAAQAQQRAAQERIDAAKAADRQAREALRIAGQDVATARAAEASLAQQSNAANARRAAGEESLRRLAGDLAEIETQAAEASSELDLLAGPQSSEAEIAAHRAGVDQARAAEQQYRREAEALMREASARQARLAAIAAETLAWHDRRNGAVTQHDRLAERRETLRASLSTVEAQPEALKTTRIRLEADCAAAKESLAAATAALNRAEALASAAEQRQIAAAQAASDAKEQEIRAEAAHEQAIETRRATIASIAEKFDCGPEQLGKIIGPDPSDEPLPDLEARLDRLRRDREAIGPVNLMAEAELTALSEELATNRAESEDLRAAVARLRQGIAELNKESRGRLLAAFETVNKHFKDLFVQLFGGGAAHLELVNYEHDPLQAGLEIMASPPGKKLQVLSLLSGGERALTALALVFAMFLTNPAPICVLDEVDAPLDDANVERFCELVRNIGARTGTRFLIVTHHRVSMAKMDRLYGVTMIEKGISRLVSVDLEETGRLRKVG